MKDLEGPGTAVEDAHSAAAYELAYGVELGAVEMTTVFAELQVTMFPYVGLHVLAVGEPVALALFLQYSWWTRCDC